MNSCEFKELLTSWMGGKSRPPSGGPSSTDFWLSLIFFYLIFILPVCVCAYCRLLCAQHIKLNDFNQICFRCGRRLSSFFAFVRPLNASTTESQPHQRFKFLFMQQIFGISIGIPLISPSKRSPKREGSDTLAALFVLSQCFCWSWEQCAKSLFGKPWKKEIQFGRWARE